MKREIQTTSAEQTFQEGSLWAQTLQSGAILACFGPLGSGKTTFLKGLISALVECDPHEVTSPTFSYLHVYEGKIPVYHFDLYRISHAEDFFRAGFDEYFHGDGVCCIEWAERIEKKLPPEALHITFEHVAPSMRRIVLK